MKNKYSNTKEAWIARDARGNLGIYGERPWKDAFKGSWKVNYPNYMPIIDEGFPTVRWEDEEPKKVYISLIEPKDTPKINWEQRRYEIAKSLFVHHSEIGGRGAIRFADKFIEELKKQSE